MIATHAGFETVSFTYRFQKSASFACSDDRGDSSSVSAIVDGPVPDELASSAEAPKPVRDYLAASPGTVINGWSSFGL